MPRQRRARSAAGGSAARRGRRLFAAALTAYVGVLAVNRSIVEVAGPSMEPTLWAGDRLLTVPAWPGAIRPGRIVVVRDPTDPDHPVVKRVHAVQGGAIDVRGDDPARSTDSRMWGPLGRDDVRRIVVARWPDLRTRLDRVG
jgi:nickel-type superoxide dismutase maturation protease